MKLIITFHKRNIYYILLVLLFCVYDFTILFQNYFGKIYSIVGVLSVLLAFYICCKILKFNIQKTLLAIIILSINSSYTSVFPIEYSSFPITWYLLAILMLIIVCFANGISKNIYFLVCLAVVVYFVVNLSWMNNNFVNSLNQLINILLFLLLLAFSKKIALAVGVVRHTELTYIFFTEVLIYSLMVILSYVAYNYSGIALGKIDLMNYRISYSATFNDYSFATLYIAAAITIIIVFIIEKQIKYNRFFFYGLLAIYLIAIIIINARTGIIALAISIGILILYESIFSCKIKAVLILPAALIIGGILFNTILQNRGGQALLDSSGRIEGYMAALNIFRNHPWLGTGFGIQNYTDISHMAIPHNLFIQYLVQFGIVGLVIVLFIVVDTFFKLIKKNGVYKWAVLTIFIGSMFIPDIISSHYLIVILILALCYEKPSALIVERNTNESSRKVDL